MPSKRTKRIPEKIKSDYKDLMEKGDDKNEKTKQQLEPKSLSTENISKE